MKKINKTKETTKSLGEKHSFKNLEIYDQDLIHINETSTKQYSSLDIIIYTYKSLNRYQED